MSFLIIEQPQSDLMGCQSACVAMLLDIPLEGVMEEFHVAYRDFDGLTSEYINHKGLKCSYAKEREAINTDNLYLCGASSLNIVGGLHCVFVDFRDGLWCLYDPNRQVEGKRYYTFDPEEAENNEYCILSTTLCPEIVVTLVDYEAYRKPRMFYWSHHESKSYGSTNSQVEFHNIMAGDGNVNIIDKEMFDKLCSEGWDHALT